MTGPVKQGENDQFGRGASTETDGSSVPAPGNLTPEQIQSLETCLAAIERDIAKILDVICHNELCRATGCDPSHMRPLSWLQTKLAPIVDIGHIPD